MNKEEARRVLRKELEAYRSRSYSELQDLIRDPEVIEARAASGTRYQIEVEAVWENQPGGDLRVIASIDDYGFLSFVHPVSEDFILRPDGSFIE